MAAGDRREDRAVERPWPRADRLAQTHLLVRSGGSVTTAAAAGKGNAAAANLSGRRAGLKSDLGPRLLSYVPRDDAFALPSPDWRSCLADARTFSAFRFRDLAGASLLRALEHAPADIAPAIRAALVD